MRWKWHELNHVQIELYRFVLANPHSTAELAAKSLDLPLWRVLRECDALRVFGLLLTSPLTSGGYVAANPEAASKTLHAEEEARLLRRQRRIDQMRAEVRSLTGYYTQVHAVRAEIPSLSLVEGESAVRGSLSRAWREARDSILAICPPSGPVLDVLREFAASGGRPEHDTGGITLRLLFSGRWQEELPAAIPVIGQYERSVARLTRIGLPWLVILDRTLAFLPSELDQPRKGALVLGVPAAVDWLEVMFDHQWSQALPAVLDPAEGLSALESAVLRALLSGATDEAAARSLQISVRSLRRRIAGLMSRLGATSRFQAGALATIRGWIP